MSDVFSTRFDGDDYVAKRDNPRLGSQIVDIYDLMKDGKGRTLTDIEGATGHPQASISAQLRHLRKPRFGSHTVNKEHVGSGLYVYTLIASEHGLVLDHGSHQ